MDAAANRVVFRLTSATAGAGWGAIAFCLSQSVGAAGLVAAGSVKMAPSDAVVVQPAAPRGSGLQVAQHVISGYTMAGVSLVAPAASTLDAAVTALNKSADGSWTATFARPLAYLPASSPSFPGAVSLPASGGVGLVVAWGAAGVGAGAGAGWLSAHRPSDAVAGVLDLSTGVFAPVGAPPLLVAHAALMATAWAGLVPLGIAVARFWRDADGGGGRWFAAHRAIMCLALALALAGLGCAAALVPAGRHFSQAHHLVGLAALALGALAPAVLAAAPSSRSASMPPSTPSTPSYMPDSGMASVWDPVSTAGAAGSVPTSRPKMLPMASSLPGAARRFTSGSSPVILRSFTGHSPVVYRSVLGPFPTSFPVRFRSVSRNFPGT